MNANVDREEVTLKESELTDKIETIGLSKRGDSLISDQSPVEFTSEEEDASNENVETVTSEPDVKAVYGEAKDKAKELGEDESKNNLLNNLGCK
jgi:hypothetical protein